MFHFEFMNNKENQKSFERRVENVKNSLVVAPVEGGISMEFMMDSIDKLDPTHFFHSANLYQHAMGDSAFQANLSEDKETVFIERR